MPRYRPTGVAQSAIKMPTLEGRNSQNEHDDNDIYNQEGLDQDGDQRRYSSERHKKSSKHSTKRTARPPPESPADHSQAGSYDSNLVLQPSKFINMPRTRKATNDDGGIDTDPRGVDAISKPKKKTARKGGKRPAQGGTSEKSGSNRPTKRSKNDIDSSEDESNSDGSSTVSEVSAPKKNCKQAHREQLKEIQALMGDSGNVTSDANGNVQLSAEALLATLSATKRKSNSIAPNQDDLLAQMHADNAKIQSKKNKNGSKKEMKTLISMVVRNVLWRAVKIPYGETQQRKAAEMCIPLLELPYLLGDSEEAKANREEWIDTYGSFLIAQINKHRGYVQARIKEASFEYMAKNDGALPSNRDMVRVLTRNLDLNVEADVSLFEFYWEKFLVKGAGTKDHWDEGKRHYDEIYKAAPPNTPGKPYITSSTEAFVVAALESNKERWEQVYAQQRANVGKQVVVKAKIDPSKPETYEEEGKEGPLFVLNHARWMPKYTKSDAGQSKDPSWTTEGRKRFLQLKRMNDNARAKPECQTLESTFLALLRQKLGLKCKTIEEERRIKRRKGPMEEAPTYEPEEDAFDEI